MRGRVFPGPGRSMSSQRTDTSLPTAAAPRFSVVIPLFNKERDVQRALRSVLEQTRTDFEVIVVDDGSTDRSAERVSEVRDPRIRMLGQANAGVSAARNTGIRASTGKFVCFLDADDEWKPTFLATVDELIERHPEAGLYATGYEVVEPNGERHPAPIATLRPAGESGLLLDYFASATAGAPPVWSSATCIPRRVFDEVGCFREGVGMGEDLDLWGRIALRHHVAYAPQVGAVYRRDAENRACARATERPPFVFARAAELELRSVRDPRFAQSVRKYVAMKLRDDVVFSLWSGQSRAARAILREMPGGVRPGTVACLWLLARLPGALCRRLPSRLQRFLL